MRHALAATIAALAVAMPHAYAMPYAGIVRGATTTFELVGNDGRRWQLEVTVTYSTPASTASGRTVVLTLTQCLRRSCSYSKTFGYDLPAADLSESVDGATVRLSTTVGGQPLEATWRRGDESYGGATQIAIGAPSAQTTSGSTALTDLSWAGAECVDTKGEMHETYRVDGASGNPFTHAPKPPASMPRGLFGPRLRCL